jgi:translation initiation factor 5A
MLAPNVSRTEYSLSNIDDGYLTLLDSEGVEKTDVKLSDDEEGAKLKEAFENGDMVSVTVIAAMGEEAVASFRVEKEK